MAKKQNRYKKLELNLTVLLIANTVVFVLYLLVAGYGILWLKAITSIFAILLSGLCLAVLFLSGELLRPRSLWLSCGFFGIMICSVVSLLLNYPSPVV